MQFFTAKLLTRPSTKAPSGLDLRTACSGPCWRRYTVRQAVLGSKNALVVRDVFLKKFGLY
jgi:hypothetical protein